MKKAKRILCLCGVFLLVLASGPIPTSKAEDYYPDDVVTLTGYRHPINPLDFSDTCIALDPMTYINQNYILKRVDGAIGTLVLFTGGDGKLGLNVENKQFGINRSTNFLVRSRHLFAAFGFNVAVMDAATDFLKCQNALGKKRKSDEHLKDIREVIKDLRLKFPGLPVWFVGISMGTISAANAAASISPTEPGAPTGLVLISSVTQDPGENVLNVSLESVRVPTLIVAHEQDECDATPPEGAAMIASRLTSARKVKILMFSEGFSPLSGECDALSYHGYFGIEPKTATRIANWVIDRIVK